MRLAMSMHSGRLDELAEKLYGISGETLMNNAADALFSKVTEDITKNLSIAVFCGRGKNGGDGFLLAVKLKNAGYSVKAVVCFSNTDNINPLTSLAMERAAEKTVPLVSLSDFQSADVYIDALLGTGFQGEINGLYKYAVEKINTGKTVIAIDLPSGLCCDNGKISNVCVKADMTYTLAIHKIGLAIYPGADYAGKISVLDIGIPQECYNGIETHVSLFDGEFAHKLYPARYENSHKGTYGKVSVFAGSAGMLGSVLLSSAAVLKAGAGLCVAAVNDEIFKSVEARVTEVIVKHDKDYKKIIENSDTLVIGSGYLSNPKISHIMKLAQHGTLPVVVDAEGLNYINNKDRKCPMVVTPHPGEFSKMIGLNTKEINENRIYLSQKYAKENNAVVVLKGARTVVSSPNGETRIIKSGTNGMATAGSGDVLAGLIGGFLAQGLSTFDAASLGAYIHGLAGELAAHDLTVYSVTASDILGNIGRAMKVNE